MLTSIFTAADHRSACRILYSLTAIALIAVALMVGALPTAASEWRYGCRGVLPSGDAPVIIFNRSSLVMLPKAWVKGPLLGAVYDRLSTASFTATDNNSGLVSRILSPPHREARSVADFGFERTLVNL